MRTLPIQTERLIAELQQSRLSRHFGPEELKDIVTYCELLEYEAGELIIREKSVDQNMYVITHNAVVVEIEAEAHSVYVCTLGEGEIIGEAGLFVNAKRTANVRAADGAQLLRMERERFLTLLKERSKIGTKLLFMIIYALLSRLRLANEELAFERRSDSQQAEIDAMIAEMMPEETIRALDEMPN